MRYLLDTNTWIEYLRRPGTAIAARLTNVDSTDVLLCSIVKAELLFGAHRSGRFTENLPLLEAVFAQFQSIPFDDRAANAYGVIRADLAGKGTPIGPNDTLISAIAVANAVTLVTQNTGEFGRVSGLRIENWAT